MISATIEFSLDQLLDGFVDTAVPAVKISSLSQDSRHLQPGALFFARSGLHHKGVDFAGTAVAAGAVAVVIDQCEVGLCPDLPVPVIAVENLIEKIGPIAARFYANPTSKMLVVGITGTNGKTSCAHFLVQAMNHSGRKTAMVGTLGNGFLGQLDPASHTTPDAIGLQQLLFQYQQQGAEAVVMEVSSHALDQGRVRGVEFNCAAFTNLSRDHLDYHGSMDQYGEAKMRLFTDYGVPAVVVNCADEFGKRVFEQSTAGSKVSVNTPYADVHQLSCTLALSGIQAKFGLYGTEFDFNSSIIGRFNLDNILIVTAVLASLGLGNESIASILEKLEPVPGRMETLQRENKPLVIIDYAHTPDALEKLLLAVREHSGGKLWCVFGCGGDRDQGKRAEMGRIADRHADRLIVTNDNPRSEAPEVIIDMICQGICQHSVDKIVDREEAITFALRNAQQNDRVIIAGKGHEDYQEIKGQRITYSDLEVCKRVMGIER